MKGISRLKRGRAEVGRSLQVTNAGVIINDHDLVGAIGELVHDSPEVEFVTVAIVALTKREKRSFSARISLCYVCCH